MDRFPILQLPPFDGGAVEVFQKIHKAGYQVSEEARMVINRNVSGRVVGGMTLIVMRGEEFLVQDRILSNAYRVLHTHGHVTPTVAQAALLPLACNMAVLEKMGLETLVLMHDPVVTPDGISRLLGVSFYRGQPWLYAYRADPNRDWGFHVGFVSVLRVNYLATLG